MTKKLSYTWFGLFISFSLFVNTTEAAIVAAVSFTGPVTGKTVVFTIALPDNYATSLINYPVVYHLHGINGAHDGNQVVTVPASFEAAAARKLIGPVILVFPDGYSDSFWADDKTGLKPAETNIVREIIPYVDAHYRTIADRRSRVIEGFSMGGFGAAKFITKFPDLFATGVIYDGALLYWQEIAKRHATVASGIFGNDEAYFNNYSPWWYLTKSGSGNVRGSVAIRLAAGALTASDRPFRDTCVKYSIPLEYVETGCAHNLRCLLDAEGINCAAFIGHRMDSLNNMTTIPNSRNGIPVTIHIAEASLLKTELVDIKGRVIRKVYSPWYREEEFHLGAMQAGLPNGKYFQISRYGNKIVGIRDLVIFH